MRQTSILPNSEVAAPIGDDLYSLYYAEINSRGFGYLAQMVNFPEVTGGILASDTLSMLLLRLAINPSMFSLLLSTTPKQDLENVIYSENTEPQKRWITDFLDDITVNVRLRNPALYDRNRDVLLDQLERTVKSQTIMTDKERKVFEDALKFFEPLLVTLHYLRKYGYVNELKPGRPEN